MSIEQEEPQFEEDLLVSESEKLQVYLGAFDGPIDMLLGLARDQKVDLAKISILALANQYLDFVEKAQKLRLELAADYLVMAAWLAYLKSRLLIPKEEEPQSPEPSANEVAEALQFQLRRLEAMRKVANDLFELPKLGEAIFPRGNPEGLRTTYVSKYDMTLYDILNSYGAITKRNNDSVYNLKPIKLYSIDEAIDKFESMLGKIAEEWLSLYMFLPKAKSDDDEIVRRSAIATTLSGALEMVKRGLFEIMQDGNFSQIYIRKPSDKKEQEVVEEDHISFDGAEIVENQIDENEETKEEVEIEEENKAEEENDNNGK